MNDTPSPPPSNPNPKTNKAVPTNESMNHSTPVNWFRYPIRVQPHHTDYGGVVWHGTYITWMESARVECIRAAGVPFDQLVSSGYDLPVVGLEIRYRQPLTLGMAATVKTRLAPITGLRMHWLYEIETASPTPQLCLSAKVTLVTVDITHRKVIRRLPSEVSNILDKITRYLDPPADERTTSKPLAKH